MELQHHSCPFLLRFQADLENQVQRDLLEVQESCTSFQVVMLEDVNGLFLLHRGNRSSGTQPAHLQALRLREEIRITVKKCT